MVLPLIIRTLGPPNQIMIKRILQILKEFKEELLKEENTWMWSIIAIFSLIFTRLILLFNFLLSGGIPS